MRNPDDLFAALARSEFRSRFRLSGSDADYLRQQTLPVVLDHARRFIVQRLAPADPARDGRQTPMRGHPAFVAQHATATCCRSCLAKWHRIAKGSKLTDAQVDYVVGVIERWLRGQMTVDTDGRSHAKHGNEGEEEEAAGRSHAKRGNESDSMVQQMLFPAD